MAHFLLVFTALWLTTSVCSTVIAVEPLVRAVDREKDFIPFMKTWLAFYAFAPALLIKSVVQAIPDWITFDVLPSVHPLYALAARDYPRLKSQYLEDR